MILGFSLENPSLKNSTFFQSKRINLKFSYPPVFSYSLTYQKRMKKSRGFKLGRKLVRVFRWFLRRKRNPSGYYQRLGGRTTTTTTSNCYKSKTMTKICNWGRCLKKGAKELCLISKNNNNKSSSSSAAGGINAYSNHYKRLDEDPFIDHHHDQHHHKPVSVPKGHLAVYVGEKDDDYHRYLVPVFYFNHPLFGELLREAEKEYGFKHPGGITIPCQISEFENVKTKIAAGGFCSKTMVNRR